MGTMNYICSFLIFMLSVYIYKNKRTIINSITSILLFTLGLAPFSWIIATKADIFENIFEVWILYFPFLLLFSIIYPYELESTKRIKGLKYYIFTPYFIYFTAVVIIKFVQMFFLPEAFKTGLWGLGLSSLISNVYKVFLIILNVVYLFIAHRMLGRKKRIFDNQMLKKQVSFIIIGIQAFAFVFLIDLLSGELNIFADVFTADRVKVMYTIAIVLNASLLAFSMIKYKFLNVEIKERSLLYYFFWAFFIFAYAGMITMILIHMKLQYNEYFMFGLYFMSFVIYNYYYRMVRRIIDYFFIRDEINYEDVVGDFFMKVMALNSFGEIRNMVINELKELLNIEEVDLIRNGSEEAVYLERKYFTFVDMHHDIRQNYRWASYFFPVSFEKRLFGFLLVGNKKAGTRFRANEIRFICSIAGQISMALHNMDVNLELSEKKIMEKEINLARKIQFSLLPPRDFESGALDVKWRYNPAIRVGGDYCDIITKEGSDDLLMVIADVSGKGINGAMYMSMVRTLLHMGMRYFSIRDIILYMNDYIKNKLPAQIFVTMALLYFDASENSFKYVHLGHNHPIMFDSVDDSLAELHGEGLGLGLVDNVKFEEKLVFRDVDLKDGDFIYLYTDGVTEAQNARGGLYGEERLKKVIAENRKEGNDKVINKVAADLYDFRGAHEQTDDIAMMVISRKAR